eukprot:m.270438 g.270438  ORF g.270438 m.270438 type:complete len:244 (-) comp19737_c2_seq2:4-735(-)
MVDRDGSINEQSEKLENKDPSVTDKIDDGENPTSEIPTSPTDDDDDVEPTQAAEKSKEISSERLAANKCPCPCKDCGGGPTAASEIGCWHNLWLLGHTQRRDYVKSPSPGKVGENATELPDEEEQQFVAIPEPLTTGEVFKQGWLRKQGGGTSGVFARRSWRNRWFVLVGTTLKYYKDETHFLAAAQNKVVGHTTVGLCGQTVCANCVREESHRWTQQSAAVNQESPSPSILTLHAAYGRPTV